jgi:hypothetical protein
MGSPQVPLPLRGRLGDAATLSLVELLDDSGRNWRENVLMTATDRFDRRLSEESGAVRVEVANGFAVVRQEIASARADILRWSFLFWIGQVAAMAGLIGLVLRAVAR